MAVIYLRHPDHGAKVACSDFEAEHDEELGWERFDPTEPDQPKDEAPPENAMAQPRRVRKN